MPCRHVCLSSITSDPDPPSPPPPPTHTQLALDAYSSGEVVIEYMSSSLSAVESASIRLSSEDIGDWVFEVTGRGLPPQSMATTTINAALGASGARVGGSAGRLIDCLLG